MSWKHCMKKKIEHKWGEIGEETQEGIHHKSISVISKGIVRTREDLDYNTVFAKVTIWAGECELQKI